MTTMRLVSLSSLALLLALTPSRAGGQDAERYRAATDRLIAAATKDSAAWNKIAELTDKFGNRLSGSQSLEDAIGWILEQMRADGLANVRGEPVMVPHWVRGDGVGDARVAAAQAAAHARTRRNGRHAGGGITAPVLVVSSFDDLHAACRRRRRERSCCSTFRFRRTAQTAAIPRRVAAAAAAAAKVGAVATLIRSVASFSIQTRTPARCATTARRRENSRRGAQHRGRGDAASHAGSRRTDHRHAAT